MTAVLGILMLETRFPRIYGDAGNPATCPFPVRIRTVADATPERVVRERAEGLVDAFVAAGRSLAEEGVAGITTTCGFLCLHQQRIGAELSVPFASSSLLQVPALSRMLPAARRIGIVTIERASLSADHLEALGIDPSTPVEGVEPGGHLASVFVGNHDVALDPAAGEYELAAAAGRLLARHWNIGAIVLECANMPPYTSALRARLGIPVYDWYSMVVWFMQGLAPRAFVAPAMQFIDAPA
jgi:hypothetical protein